VNGWVAVILASIAVYSWKLFGYLLPKRFLESEILTRLSGYLTIALLAGLVGVQTFVKTESNQDSKLPVLDERFVALIVAAILLKLRAPFIVVVVSSATTAALLRLAF